MIKKELKTKFENIINSLSIDGDIRFSVIKANCTRFANSVITQNTSNLEQILTITLAKKKDDGYKLISKSTGEVEKIEELIKNMEETIDESSINKEFKGFLKQYDSPNVKTFFPSTGSISLIDKAKLIEKIIKSGDGLITGGILETEHETFFSINSNGQKIEEDFSSYKVDVKYENKEGNSSSFQETGRDIEKFDYETISKKAAEKCKINLELKEVKNGKYNILFSPSATSELIYFLSQIGFGGREYKQKRSFVYGKIGKKIIDNSKVTIINNPLNPLTLTKNFDSEGIAKKEVILIENGIAKNVAHNTLTVEKIEDSNGNSMGAMAYAMLMEMVGGDRTSEEIINSCENTIFISRFHYPTIDNKNKIILKGSTKDGTFLINKGEYKPIKNLEFIFEIPHLLGKIIELSKNREVLPQGSLASSLPGANVVPFTLVGELEVEGGKVMMT